MRKLDRDEVVAEALALLNEVGLDRITTRVLAQRLGVEQPALYWHFRNKDALLEAMAEVALAPHIDRPWPATDDHWRDWMTEFFRVFRTTLLAHRDGARLQSGRTPPAEGFDRMRHNMAFMVSAGFREPDVLNGMLAAGRFTLGCALEQQAEEKRGGLPTNALPWPMPDHGEVFEFGLEHIVEGLAARRT